MKNPRLMAILVLLAFAISRWPGLMPLNFSAGYAIAFCCGVFRHRMPWTWALGALVVTDVLKNVLYYHAPAMNFFSILNYVAFGLIYGLGRQYSRKNSVPSLAGGGLLGALLFYLVTNTGAWIQNPEYAKTLGGWFQALTTGTVGWPQTWEFFRNTLLSGGLFTITVSSLLKMTEPRETEEAVPQEDEIPATEDEQGSERDAAHNESH